MNMRYSCLIFLGISFTFFLCGGIVDARAQSHSDLDSLLQRMVEKTGQAGIAVAVVHKDSLIYARQFGFRDVERRLPVTERTVFPVGSCTKPMTAALIGILGLQVSIDGPVQQYLPGLDLPASLKRGEVTVRDLLCHRSGLPRHEYAWYCMPAGNRDSLIKRVAWLEPNVRTGEKWQYNNWGYLLLGMMAEKITGMKYESAIHRYLLQPMRMQRSYFSLDSLLTDTDAAVGYQMVQGKPERLAYHPMQLMAPAGGLNSTAADIARWLSGWITGRSPVPAEYRKMAVSSQVVTKAALPVPDQAGSFFSNYGLGWFLAAYRGHYRVEHGGNIDGFTSTASFFPADSLGIVVLCNRDGSLLPAQFRNTIADYFFHLSPIDRTITPVTNTSVKKNGDPVTPAPAMPPTHTLAAYTGEYTHPGYGQMMVVRRGDSLFAAKGLYTWWLWPQQYDAFRMVDYEAGKQLHKENARLSLQFLLHQRGEVESLIIPFEPTVKPIEFKKQFLPRRPDTTFMNQRIK